MDRINAFIIDLMTSINSRDEEEGQTLVEYALIIALVSVALVFGLGALRGGIDDVFTKIVGSFGAS